MNLKSLMMMVLVAVMMASCGTPKKINYLTDADQIPQEVLQQAAKASDPVIMPGDMLRINVTSLNTEAVKPFNKSVYMEGMGSTSTLNNTQGAANTLYYLVDNNGDIDFPVLGSLHVGGLTKSEIQNNIISQIYPRYLTEKPAVEIRLSNFQVTVLGAVNSPGIKTSPNEQLNILEAVALAGDLNIKGVRDNIMIIRTDKDGTRSIHRVDLTDKNLLVSPYFNLQQNDVIYVQPNDSMARSSWTVPPAWSMGTSILGTLISIATFVITLTKL